MNKAVRKASTASGTGRKTKKGSLTRKTKTERATARFYEVKIRLSAEDFERGRPFFENLKHLPKYLTDAYAEKVSRAESHDKQQIQRRMNSDIKLLMPILKEAHSQGLLNFLTQPAGRSNV